MGRLEPYARSDPEGPANSESKDFLGEIGNKCHNNTDPYRCQDTFRRLTEWLIGSSGTYETLSRLSRISGKLPLRVSGRATIRWSRRWAPMPRLLVSISNFHVLVGHILNLEMGSGIQTPKLFLTRT